MPTDVLDFADLRRVLIDDRLGEAIHRRGVGLSVADVVDERRVGAEGGFLFFAVGRVGDRHDPLRRALDMDELARTPGECGDDLHAGRAAADDADAPAVQRHRMIPLCRVKGWPGKAVQAGQLGHAGMVEDAGGGDHHIGVVDQSAGGFELPAIVLEFAARHFLAELDHLVERVLLRHGFEVALDFRPGCEVAAPFRIGGEGVGVGMGGNVTRQTRISVLAPGAADALGLLIDDDLVLARLAQADGGQDAGHAGADDDDAKRLRRRVCDSHGGESLRGEIGTEVLSRGQGRSISCRTPL